LIVVLSFLSGTYISQHSSFK